MSKRPEITGKKGRSLNLTISIPEAGAMVGLGRNASYDAAKRGQIPTLEFGRLKRVPRLPWLRKLGVEAAE